MVELIVRKGTASPLVVQVRDADEMDAALAQILDAYPANPTESWEIGMRVRDSLKTITIDPDFIRRIDRELAQA